MRRFAKPVGYLLLVLVTVQPVAALQPLDGVISTDCGVEGGTQPNVSTQRDTGGLAKQLGLENIRARTAREKQWDPRGPGSPMLARGLYFTGLAGLGFTAYYAFRNIRSINSTGTRREVVGLTAISFASLYLSYRIELDSSGDSSK